jgi:hypothetical protein
VAGKSGAQGDLEDRLAGANEPGCSLLQTQAFDEFPGGLAHHPGKVTVDLKPGLPGAPGNISERQIPIQATAQAVEQMKKFLSPHGR